MSTEYGVWSGESGGFVVTGAWSSGEADRDRQAEVDRADPEDRADAGEDLTVRAICPDHEEQPADGCEDCAAAEDDELCANCAEVLEDNLSDIVGDDLCADCRAAEDEDED